MNERKNIVVHETRDQKCSLKSQIQSYVRVYSKSQSFFCCLPILSRPIVFYSFAKRFFAFCFILFCKTNLHVTPSQQQVFTNSEGTGIYLVSPYICKWLLKIISIIHTLYTCSNDFSANITIKQHIYQNQIKASARVEDGGTPLTPTSVNSKQFFSLRIQRVLPYFQIVTRLG